MKYAIRQMIVADISDVIMGETKIFGKSLGFDMLYSDLVMNPYAHYFVLEVDEKVHGYIGLWIDEHADIINFYVDTEYQGMGFGSMIIDFVINLCELSKVKNISLEVRVSNKRAINLYQKFGFIESHIRKAYYENGEDAIVMIKNFEV